MPSACRLSQLFGNTSSGRAASRSPANACTRTPAAASATARRRTRAAPRSAALRHAFACAALEEVRAGGLGVAAEVRGADHQHGVGRLRLAGGGRCFPAAHRGQLAAGFCAASRSRSATVSATASRSSSSGVDVARAQRAPRPALRHSSRVRRAAVARLLRAAACCGTVASTSR